LRGPRGPPQRFYEAPGARSLDALRLRANASGSDPNPAARARGAHSDACPWAKLASLLDALEASADGRAGARAADDATLAGDRSAYWGALRAAERSGACARSALDRLARAALDADPRAAEGGGALAARLRGLKADLVRRPAGVQAPALRAHAVSASCQQNA
jgi:hypothetical protein